MLYPQALYASFENSDADQFNQSWFDGRTPHIGAYRPQNTYYRGWFSSADIQATGPPMRPMIVVVSMVRLYFQSPANSDAGAAKTGF